MVTFNGYIQKNSIIHNLNPSLKFLGFVFLIVMIFMPVGFFGHLILLLMVISIWFMSKLPWRVMRSIINSILVMVVIITAINWVTFKSPELLIYDESKFHLMFGNFDNIKNLFFNQTEINHEIIYYSTGSLWGGQIASNLQIYSPDLKDYTNYITVNYHNMKLSLGYTPEWYALSSHVLIVSASICMKIFLMITIVTMLTATTNSIQLTFAIEDILVPFKYLKIPVNEWAMTISIAIRFVPSLLDESQRILKAQASRGVDFSNGNFKDKIKSLISLVVPMFAIAFKKADDLSNAMEARSYNPRYVRTRYRNYKVKVLDWLVFGLILVFFGFMIIIVAKHLIFAPFFIVDAFI